MECLSTIQIYNNYSDYDTQYDSDNSNSNTTDYDSDSDPSNSDPSNSDPSDSDSDPSNSDPSDSNSKSTTKQSNSKKRKCEDINTEIDLDGSPIEKGSDNTPNEEESDDSLEIPRIISKWSKSNVMIKKII